MRENARRALGGAALVLVLAGGATALAPAADAAAPDYRFAAARDTEPVVMEGTAFGNWTTPANQTVKLPLLDLLECQSFDESCKHNNYSKPEIDTGEAGGKGTPIDRVLGYRWDAGESRFVRIPLQVDEMFTRYLDNSASGFSVYSGNDQHTTYAFDREGYRYTASDPNDPCKAVPATDPASNDPTPGGPETTKDPVEGFDYNDELAFMAEDAGPQMPQDGRPLPDGIQDAYGIAVSDPTASKIIGYVYVMRAKADGPRNTGGQSYVSYSRDANADSFERSQSSYDGYGNAARGVVCDANGNVVRNPDGSPKVERRRPRDYATVQTDRYRFRYDGRWLMTDIRISDNGGASFGPDLVDRWKARAFQQDPGSETPCCGYEEEDTNWGGSSTLIGERSGPVRTIRETWGADSGTNVIRRETFYRRELRQKTFLRVHVIPPLDGIYAQWDFNAGRMTSYYNPQHTGPGVNIDGRNDEAFGNLDDPCNHNYDTNDTSQIDQTYRAFYRGVPGLCDPILGQQQLKFPYHQSVDVSDPSFGELNAALQWNVTAGPNGSIVDRYQIDKVTDITPGGAVQSLAAVPYYRDDSCFDDGTGTDPGPKLRLRSADEPRTASDGSPRRCWGTADGVPDGSDRFFQGSIGTHGLHLLFLADSDNARQTVPLTEVVAEQRMVMLPGFRGGIEGERYGRGFEKPTSSSTLYMPGSASSGSAATSTSTARKPGLLGGVTGLLR